jgi:dCTP deaminase
VILSDHEIRAAVGREDIGLTPLPLDARRWSPTSVDLTLDREIRPWRTISGAGGEAVIEPGSDAFNSNELIARHTNAETCDGENGYVIEPGEFVLGWTVEKLKLPVGSRIGARVEGKSSLARIGLGVHVTAPTIHPGFGVDPIRLDYPGSPIRLEIWNAGPLRIRLVKGMAICQLLFETVYGTPEGSYTGQFAVQGPGPVAPTSRPGKRRRS